MAKFRQGSDFPGFPEPRKTSKKTLVAAIRQAFDQPDGKSVGETWRCVADQIRSRWPNLADLMNESEHEGMDPILNITT